MREVLLLFCVSVVVSQIRQAPPLGPVKIYRIPQKVCRSPKLKNTVPRILALVCARTEIRLLEHQNLGTYLRKSNINGQTQLRSNFDSLNSLEVEVLIVGVV